MKNLKKAAMVLGISAMAAMMSFPVFASEKIEDITLEIESYIYAGESGSDVDVILDNDGCYVDSVTVTNEPDEWEEDDKPKLRIILKTEDDYIFASGLGKDDVALDEDTGTITSVSRSSSTKLTINVTLTELYYSDDYDDDDYDLDVYDLAWDQAGGGYGCWDGSDYAKRYEVRLFRDGEAVTSTLTTEKTSYNFSGYFTKGGDYTFKVRAVRNSNNTSSWRESEDWDVSDEEAAWLRGNAQTAAGAGGEVTEGAWLKDTIGYWWCNPDRTYPVAEWKYINGAWYYFNESGYCVMNQWVNTAGKWYYCGESGAMLISQMIDGKYYVNKDGEWVQ